ncbi:hypothetical protein [Planktomarina sp.]|uniref:hypothetical protein n=1 Tax=Planktomarina sp. TaxID=2024851 RepID=UPI003261BA65
MNYELTIFKSQFDNKTHRTMSLKSWDKFVELLYGLSQTKGEKGGRNSSPLITPAVFEADSTRSNKSTLYWGGWCAVDVDNHNFTNDLDSLRGELIDRFRDLDFICYSTASSRDQYLKFRIVFRLSETIERDTIKSFWYALNTEIGEIGDPQTKDLARMYYVPAIYPSSTNFFFSHLGGNPINVGELIAKHPYVQKTGNSFLDRLPPEMQKAVVEHRKNSLNNTNFNWTSYRDCPFWPKRLGIEYQTISETGWYAKMYAIMIAIAGSAVSRGYPISSNQISRLCEEFDKETGNWYENRPLSVEADRALEYVYRNG